MNSFRELKHLLPNAEKKLQSIMNVERDQAKIFISKPSKNGFIRFSENFQEEMFPLDCGIAGAVYKTGEYVSIPNIYNNELYNGLIDINTTLPVICMPITILSTNKTIGVFEVPNPKGVRYTNKKNEIATNDLEILEFFSHQLAQVIMFFNQEEFS